MTTITERISESGNDAEEYVSTGAVDITSSDLEIMHEFSGSSLSEQLIGLRWALDIPNGAKIENAFITFTTEGLSPVDVVDMTFRCENVDNSLIFTTLNSDISNRTLTTAVVEWNAIPRWLTLGEEHDSPDIKSLIQEVVNRAGWSSGNSLAVIMQSANGETGDREAESYDGNPTLAALITITYTNIPVIMNQLRNQRIS